MRKEMARGVTGGHEIVAGSRKCKEGSRKYNEEKKGGHSRLTGSMKVLQCYKGTQ